MRPPSSSLIRTESGLSLVELLVAMTITVMVGITITSVLMAIITNARRDAQQTARYESLRLAAHQIMRDGRRAVKAESNWDGAVLKLALNADGSDYIKYTFAAYDPLDPGGEGIPDPQNLHRWVVKGGDWRDEIVAWDLVPPETGPTETTRFEAASALPNYWARATLVKPPLPGQTTPIQITAYVHLR